MCVNYLLAEDNLELKRRNRFQAIEAITIKPLYGPDVFKRFFESNQWISEYFPNQFPPKTEHLSNKRSIIKRIMEFALKGKLGDNLEQKSLYEFRKHGAMKYPNAAQSRFSYESNESIYLPTNFENKVLENYRQRVVLLQQQSF